MSRKLEYLFFGCSGSISILVDEPLNLAFVIQCSTNNARSTHWILLVHKSLISHPQIPRSDPHVV